MHARGAALAASTATGVTAAVTGANRLMEFRVDVLASTPDAIADGRVWLLGRLAGPSRRLVVLGRDALSLQRPAVGRG